MDSTIVTIKNRIFPYVQPAYGATHSLIQKHQGQVPPPEYLPGRSAYRNKGLPCPIMSVRNSGSRITNTRNITYFSFRSSLSPSERSGSFLGKGILFSKSWISPKGHRNPHTSLPEKRPYKNQESDHIIGEFEVPASNHRLQRTNGTGAGGTRAGIAV